MTTITESEATTTAIDWQDAEQATVEFSDILEASKIVPDENYSESPWDNCDGYEHHLIDDLSDGQANGSFYSDNYRKGQKLIVLDNPLSWGNFAYYRTRGASKQVAYQLQKANEKQTIDFLRAWYNGNVWYYGVTCEFQGESDDCWGYDSINGDMKFIESQRIEHAENVAHALERKGIVVTGKPDKRAQRLADFRATLKANLHSQDAR